MRDYNWEFPLNVPGWTGHVQRLVDALVKNDLWPSGGKGKIPVALALRLEEARANGKGVTITKEDLDTIPDDVWAKVEVLIKKMKGQV